MSKQEPRRFEFNDGKSSKFWEIELDAAWFTVRYGKTGTVGQSQTKEFKDSTAATKAAEKLIAEKTGKGYKEVETLKVTGHALHQATNDAPTARIPTSLSRQYKKVTDARRRVEAYLAEHKDELSDDGISDESSTFETITRILNFLEPSYLVRVQRIEATAIDRLKSMLSGPLFCSKKYPCPKSKKGAFLAPVLQLDTEWLNRRCEKSFQPGLIQVWGFDFLRFIPAEDVSEKHLIALDAASISDTAEGAIMINPAWGFPSTNTASQITDVIAIGMTCPDIANELPDAESLPDEIIDDLSIIESSGLSPKAKDAGEDFSLFGKFPSGQVGAGAYYPSRLLATYRFGLSGSTEIFCSERPGGRYEFRANCVGR